MRGFKPSGDGIVRNPESLILKYRRQFESFVTHNSTQGTAQRYGRALETFFSYFPEKTEPGHWGKNDILDWRIWRRRKVTASTVNYEIQVVRRMWNWLIQMEVTTYNPTNGVPRFREMEQPKTSLGEAAQEKLYDACLDDNESMLVGLALTTGLRANTMRQLEKRDFDLEQCVLVLEPEKMKTGKALMLQIRPEECELVKKASAEGTIWGEWAKTHRALEYRWNKICRRAGLDIRGLRSARRTTATTLLRNGLDVRSVQEWLGHKKLTTTMKYLTPANRVETRAALDKLPGRAKE